MREQKTGYTKFHAHTILDLPEIMSDDWLDIIERVRSEHIIELDKICVYDYGVIIIPTTKGNVGFFMADIYSDREGGKIAEYFRGKFGDRVECFLYPFEPFLKTTHQSLK